MGVLDPLGTWPVGSAAAAVVDAGGTVLETYGDQGAVFWLASVTKPLVALSVLVASRRARSPWTTRPAPGLDRPAPARARRRHRPGQEPRHRQARTAGSTPTPASTSSATAWPRSPASPAPTTAPGAVRAAGPGRDRAGRAARTAAAGPASADLATVVAELLAPRALLHPSTVAELATVQFPGLSGVVPGFGRQPTNDWGLGFEVRDSKSPHWTGAANSPATFGTSAGRARSSGSTRWRGWGWSCSPTPSSSSGEGRLAAARGRCASRPPRRRWPRASELPVVDRGEPRP